VSDILSAMGTRERPGDGGAITAQRIVAAMAVDLRETRISAGLSQRALARAAGVSQSQVSRLELGMLEQPTVEQLARVSRCLGLRLHMRLFPDGAPLRDEAHVALLHRLRRRLPNLSLRFEVPLPGAGEQRAWDAGAPVEAGMVAFEAETRLRDVQALVRRIEAKRRDDPEVVAVVLVASDTANNRRVLTVAGDLLRAQLPLGSRSVLAALARNEAPSPGGIVLL
jgi:transcriptional regulator with XRE-family HTH domain